MTFVKKKRARVRVVAPLLAPKVTLHAEMEKLFIQDQTEECQNQRPNYLRCFPSLNGHVSRSLLVCANIGKMSNQFYKVDMCR